MTRKANSGVPTILEREGKGWRQFLVVSDGRVAIVDMEPAMLVGWNIKRVTVQGESDWPKMSRDQIVAYKFRHDDGLTKHADLSGSFIDKLLARAAEGR